MSVFTNIINGTIPCYKIVEDENFIAFLDINPIVLGHILVVPKVEVDIFFELSDNLLTSILQFAKPIAIAQKKCIVCNRIGIATIGLEVPHAHLHLVPITTADDLNFTRPKLKVEPLQLAAMQKLILEHL